MSLRVFINDLALARGDLLVAQNISFDVQAGGALVVRGPNGSGKSTLLAALAGLLAPLAGEVSEAISDNAILIGHQDGLKPQMTVLENLQFWAAYANAGEQAGVALEALNLANLADIPAGMLSQGQKRRASLARALVSGRKIWLLDEPTTALDAANQDRLTELMAAHRAGGGIVIAATHSPLILSDAQELVMGGAA